MPNLSTNDGTPTGGVFGFAVMALEVIRRLKPDYVAVAWDKPKTNIRSRVKMYPEYKAGRKPAPPDFYVQIPILHELLQAFGWPLYELDDYEADDIMGTLAHQAQAQGIETLLVTSDLDALQLVGPLTKVYIMKTGLSNIELYSPSSFEAKYYLKVDQFLDLKALKGDSSDNIPGVPGIGEKTATELLRQYKTLEGVYDNLDVIKNSVRKKLEAGKDMALLSKKLGSIWLDAPIKLDLKAVDGSKIEPEKVLDLLEKLEFRSLVRQLPEVMQVAIDNHHTKNNSFTDLKPIRSFVIDTDEKLNRLNLSDYQEVFVYSRAFGRHGRDPSLLAVSDGQNVYIIKVRLLTPTLLLSKLGELGSIIGYDVKSTLKVFLNLGLKLPKVEHDVQVAAFILNPLRRDRSLGELVAADIGLAGSSFDDLDEDELTTKLPEIIAVIKLLYDRQIHQLRQYTKLKELVERIEWPLIPVLARMEFAGIELDTEYLKNMSKKVNDALNGLEQQIYGFAGQEFNISSPAQLADVLFGILKLPKTGIKKGKTGYSTAAAELYKLKGTHQIIDLISGYRELSKLKNTYIDALPKLVDSDSRLHTTFNLTIAQTGRLSSTDPNLQNIPVRTELGREIRTAFVAGKGKRLISADYSQFELRIAAYLADDKTLIDQFNRNIDVHTATAAEIYQRDPDDVSKNMRREAKVVNFGVMYGLSAHGLVEATGLSYEQAQKFIKRYFEVRPKLLKYIDSIKVQADTEGYVETLFGRRRPTPDVHSSNYAVRESSMRAAVNMPFQGTAADIMKIAMIDADRVLHEAYPSARILLQIHDSLIVECDEKDSAAVAKLLQKTMECAVKLKIKFTVDVTVGQNWGEL